MNVEDLRSYCLSFQGTEETFPFGPDNLVYKVLGKVFLICGMDAAPLSFNVKCEPEKAEELREQYPCVVPGYHMNKKHWNTIEADGSVSDALLRQWIRDSYELVGRSLPKKERTQIGLN